MERPLSLGSRWTAVSPALVMLMLISSAACSDDNDILVLPGPFQLTFSLDASFQAAHGGQPIEIALVRSADGFVVAQTSGAVSATQDPSFSFTAGTVLARGIAYEVHYWIDSNINGGTLGVCDPKAIDYQWSVEFPSPTNDVAFTASHQPSLTEDVCDTFD